MTTKTMRNKFEEHERLPDPLDAGKQFIERETEEEIKAIQAKAHLLEGAFTGECLNPNCGHTFGKKEKKRWCNDVCRDEWQDLRDRKKKGYSRGR